jgi:hypothetical protein
MEGMMSKLRVSFLAGAFGLLPIDETVLGSFIWDTTTNTLSNISITSYGPYQFIPTIIQTSFSPPPATYPPGSLTFFEFAANVADTSRDVLFQMNYDDRGYSDPPIIPAAGHYFNVPFDLGGAGLGRNVPGTGAVIVTPI